MHRIASTLTLGFVLALTGCGDDGSTDTGAGGSSSTGAADSTTTGGNTNPATTNADTTAGPTTDEPGTTTDGPGTTTDSPGTTTDDPGSTTDDPGTTGGGMACAPDPGDDMCAQCVKMDCCPELEACNLDADCVCFQECAEMNPGIGGAIQCGTDCGVNPLAPGTPTGSLASCTQTNCGMGICL